MSTIQKRISVNFDNLNQWIDSRDNLLGYLLLLPAVLVFLFLSVLPILYGIWISFHSGAGSNLDFVGLSNYQNLLFADSNFWHSVWLGAVYAVYSVVLQTVAGVAIALLLNETFRFQNFVRTLVLVTYLIPTVAVAIIFRFLLDHQIGVLNYYLITYTPVDDTINFFSQELAIHSVTWISGWKFTIFVVLIILARLQSIDSELYELARINGANAFRRFIDVTYPHIRSALFLVILLRGIFMFNKFDMIYILTRGGPFDSTRTMVIYAYYQAFGRADYGTGAAVTTIMFLLLAVVAIIYFYYFAPEEEVES
ncbi:carbohydrate ABC transporter permease [Natrarchaeobius chitinivorans]|uniref:Sugar ABC transporter permease n=1 Tax=Natrarchaeobius chitinivorans TaxID=1679083 RepID=A0A3N6LTQ6_NATCH|nr:sugar ABC transporter permease [Natrarchaeobius chitinivorans]RQG93528.1 sugar ABC transporter permease [Natrarchaeobius chitinivorans]